MEREIAEEEEYEAEDADYLEEQEFEDEYEDKQGESTAPSARVRPLDEKLERESTKKTKKTGGKKSRVKKKAGTPTKKKKRR